jgi:membrane fusion protein (multidrug efflux system)
MLALLVAVAGAVFIYLPATSESTNDAYLSADSTTVAPKVRGLVAQVLVQDNQAVRAGDPLIRIDGEEFDARVATARADLADAESGVAAARAALASLTHEERLAADSVVAAGTQIRSARAQSERAVADSQRFSALLTSGSVARRDAEVVRAGAVTAEQDVAHSEAAFAVAEDARRVTMARRPLLDAGLLKAEATVQRARAALELALQDQRNTLIRAPMDGVVGNRHVQQGDFVQPGTRLLTLVPRDSLYVLANFKETQTSRMVPGQRVELQVDALSAQPLQGHVQSLAPASGSQFALLPFEPGTGNFTKIVQRVAVRIEFDSPSPQLAALRPGLSVTAKVRLKPDASTPNSH